MRYKQLKTDLFTDYMFAHITSTRGNTPGGQVYTNTTDWLKIYPTPSNGDCHETFDLLTHHEGIPDFLILDLCGFAFKRHNNTIRDFSIFFYIYIRKIIEFSFRLLAAATRQSRGCHSFSVLLFFLAL
jgi:hypothetical protein